MLKKNIFLILLVLLIVVILAFWRPWAKGSDASSNTSSQQVSTAASQSSASSTSGMPTAECIQSMEKMAGGGAVFHRKPENKSFITSVTFTGLSGCKKAVVIIGSYLSGNDQKYCAKFSTDLQDGSAELLINYDENSCKHEISETRIGIW